MDSVLIAPIEGELLDFGDLYEREFTRVYRASWLLARDDDVALEATQEAFAKAWARWRRLGRHQWVVGWIMRTALNEVRDRSRMASADVKLKDQVVTDPSASLMDLRRALRTLPPRRREALVLFYLGDLPVSGVADAMNTSEGTVKAQLAQGREQLRKLLEADDD